MGTLGSVFFLLVDLSIMWECGNGAHRNKNRKESIACDPANTKMFSYICETKTSMSFITTLRFNKEVSHNGWRLLFLEASRAPLVSSC